MKTLTCPSYTVETLDADTIARCTKWEGTPQSPFMPGVAVRSGNQLYEFLSSVHVSVQQPKVQLLAYGLRDEKGEIHMELDTKSVRLAQES